MESSEGFPGSGDVPWPSVAEFNLLRKAARRRWGVPDHVRALALYQAQETLRDPMAHPKAKAAAAKLLIEADRIDLDSDKFDLANRADPPRSGDYEILVDLTPDDPAAADPAQ